MHAHRLAYGELLEFCIRVFARYGLSQEDARICALVLLEADLRGIPSHGIARLARYVEGFRTGQMLPGDLSTLLSEGPTSLVVDCGGGMGMPVSVRTMEKVVGKARISGAAFACVRNSNHYGFAGYYAMMAPPQGMLGFCMTNTAALGVPTFGRQVMFGTNPIAFAAPAARERDFVLDMSTTVVTRGKIEVYDRAGKEIPEGWAVEKHGLPATEPASLLDDMFHRIGGGILPLGGAGEAFGGHKGYGLAVMVDILCAVLAGAPTGPEISDTEASSARVSHFFGAIDIARFRDPEDFRRDMDGMLARLRNAEPAEGEERVYYAGLKEAEKTEELRKKGIPLQEKTYAMLRELSGTTGIPF